MCFPLPSSSHSGVLQCRQEEQESVKGIEGECPHEERARSRRESSEEASAGGEEQRKCWMKGRKSASVAWMKGRRSGE